MPPEKQSNKRDFNAFTIKHSGIASRIVTAVRLSEAFDPAQPPDSPVGQFETTALWDTGATKSVVTQATANALRLIPIGTTIVSHAGGSGPSNTYLVNFYLPSNVMVIGVLVSECHDIAGNFGAIIGMDIISQGDFAITNVNGQTWMTFRIPPIQSIDYVVEANKVKFAGVARNAPCPCGNKDPYGKPIKYKYCHGKAG